MRSFTNNQSSQAGIASITVTMIMMIVISLIVLSFAQIARREQRQSIDRQLSVQAYYAAESGANIARTAILASPSPIMKNTCGPNAQFPNNVIDAQTNVSITCLLINSLPPSVNFSNVGPDVSKVMALSSNTGTFSSITISWQDSSMVANFGGCPALTSFPPLANWPTYICSAAVLRTDLVSGAGGLDSASLASRTFTSYLKPWSSGAGSVGYNPTNTGTIVQSKCVTNPPAGVYDCSVTINNLTQSLYYLRFRPIYLTSDVQITGINNSGNPVLFQGVQAIIDSTGKAQDELKRIQVHIDLGSIGSNLSGSATSIAPNDAIETEHSLCKSFAVAPNFYSNGATGNGTGCDAVPF